MPQCLGRGCHLSYLPVIHLRVRVGLGRSVAAGPRLPGTTQSGSRSGPPSDHDDQPPESRCLALAVGHCQCRQPGPENHPGPAGRDLVLCHGRLGAESESARAAYSVSPSLISCRRIQPLPYPYFGPACNSESPPVSHPSQNRQHAVGLVY